MFNSVSISNPMRRCGCMALSMMALLLMSPGIDSLHADDTSHGDQLLAEYFRQKTAELADRSLADIQTAEDWNSKKEEYRRQLQEMLGLDPLPERTPLNPVITDRIEHDDFIVEKLHFESSPGLYVTANYYRPIEVKKPLPSILYVCGHSVQKKNGVSYGNKTGYQHHGIWFARNGYTCLTIDTIQLGEIQGLHHGTHHEGMWWWHSRGYTPLGVEAWNGIRALDYLQSREEVDPDRIGMTGRSGGGAYTWFVSALDERVKVSVPVAGITNMKNHVVDGCVAGHCDCMYQTNLYGWDFPQVAALIAPRPLLITNTDKDRIFPLDGVVDVYTKTRRIYKLLGEEDHIGLCIAEGGHRDVQQIQNDAFLWFNRFLKNDMNQISMITEKLFKPEELTTFETIPADERVTSVQEWFIPGHDVLDKAKTREDFLKAMQPAIRSLQEGAKTASTANKPQKHEPAKLNVKLVSTLKNKAENLRLRKFEFDSESPYRLPFYVIDFATEPTKGPIRLEILDESSWAPHMAEVKASFPEFEDAAEIKASSKGLPESHGILVLFAPRGVGATRWSDDLKTRTHIRRRFALLGTTEDRVRVEDVRRAIAAVHETLKVDLQHLTIQATGEAAGWAMPATLLAGGVEQLDLQGMATSYRGGPQFLGLHQLANLKDLVVATAIECGSITLKSEKPADVKAWTQLKSKAASIGVKNIEVKKQ